MEPIDADRCPELTVLQRFLREDVSSECANDVEAHLAHCAACQAILDDLIDHQPHLNSVVRLLKEQASSLFFGGGPQRGAVSTAAFPFRRAASVKPSRATEDRSNSEQNPLPASIGGYRVLAELGRGAYGVVYHAHDDVLDRSVAIKLPHPEVVEAAGGVELYLKEARMLARLDHPHIVRVYEARSDASGTCYIVSQFIAGRSLAARLKEGPVDPVEAARLIAPLADALQHAHERGIWHRDVKPANILLDESGKPYLTDFGLALKEDEIGRGPRFLGTPAYMSPEQARSEGHRVDGRTDVFSLGVVLYELLTGKRPFLAPSADELLRLIVKVDAPSARQRNRCVPRELDRICAKALARQLSDRYPSAGDLADDLNAWLETEEAKSKRRLDGGSDAAASPGDSLEGSEQLLDGAPASVPSLGPVAGLVRRSGPWTLLAAATALVLPLALVLTAAVRPAPAPNVLRVGIKPWVGFSPLVVADELGLCGDVDLVLTPVRNTTDTRQSIRARELDAAPYLIDSHALARANRTPVKAVLQLDVSLEADGVVAREGLETFGDLRGKTIAYIHHEAPHFLLLSLCEKYGLATDEFRHETAETAQDAVNLFLVGKADAVVTYEPFLQRALLRPGAHRLASAADDPGAVIDILTVREDLLQTDRRKIKALISGWMKAVELLEQGDPAAVEIACRFLGDPARPLHPKEYHAMAAGMRYGTKEENLKFFRINAGGTSEFRQRMDAAQRRWDRHQQILRLTDPEDGDGSDILWEMYEPGVGSRESRRMASVGA